MEIIGKTKDLRTGTSIIYAKVPIVEYLNLVGDDFDSFSIQRRKEKHKAYSRMKHDISKGALLPTITLAIKPELVDSLISDVVSWDLTNLVRRLMDPGQVSILDGLQRTFIMRDLLDSGHEFDQQQTLLVEFWFEKDIEKLIYRLIVLNAGQKPMSMRHQIEVLFKTFKTSLENDISGLRLIEERDEERRVSAGVFPLSKVVSAYQSYLFKSSEIKKDNIVAQAMAEEEVMSSDESALTDKFTQFKHYLSLYCELDFALLSKYTELLDGNFSVTSWFGGENVLNSFFAAVAAFGTNAERTARIEVALSSLLDEIKTSTCDDPIDLRAMNQIMAGIPVRKLNVGFATRRFLVAAFKEFFRREGAVPLREIWLTEAE
jgi:hypothetical protein